MVIGGGHVMGQFAILEAWAHRVKIGSLVKDCHEQEKAVFRWWGIMSASSISDRPGGRSISPLTSEPLKFAHWKWPDGTRREIWSTVPASEQASFKNLEAG
jgi:hypothetical protein